MKTRNIFVFVVMMTVLISGLWAQSLSSDGDPRYPISNNVGIGYNYSQYTTKWTGVPAPNAVNPVHVHVKNQASIYYERRSLTQMGSFHLDFRGEVLFGVMGETRQDYITDAPELISDGGQNMGGNILFRFVIPLMTSARTQFAPFLGIGVGYHILQSNGEGLDDVYTTSTAYTDLSYNAGWTETMLIAPLSAGFNLDMSSFVISPEVRFSPAAWVFPDWNPGDPPSISSAQFFSGAINIGFISPL